MVHLAVFQGQRTAPRHRIARCPADILVEAGQRSSRTETHKYGLAALRVGCKSDGNFSALLRVKDSLVDFSTISGGYAKK